MSNGKQSVTKAFGILGEKRKKKGRARRQKVGGIPIGLLASFGAPMLSEIAKPIFRKIIGKDRRKRRRRR